MKSLTVTEVQNIEKRIGRKLTPREIVMGELAREDNRTHSERYDASHWQPKMAEKKGGTIFDDAVASAEKAAEAERFNSLTMAQKRLAMYRESQAKALQAQADEAAMAEHLKTHAPQIERLQALKDSIRFDPSWSAGDVQAIDFALQQIQAGPNADAAETQRLFNEPFRILAQKKQALLN